MADKFDVQRATPSIESSIMERIKQQREQAAAEAAAAAEAEKMTQIRLAKNQEGPGAYAQRPGGIPYRGQRAEDQAVVMEQGLHRGRISPGQSDMSARLYRDGMRTGDMSGYYDFMATQDIGNLIGGEEVALHGLGRGLQAARAASAARAMRPKVTPGSVLAGDLAQSMRGAPSGSTNMSITPEYEDAIRNEVFDTAPDYYARKPEEFEVAVQRAIDDFMGTGTITDANAPRSMSDLDIEQREALDIDEETRLFDEAEQRDIDEMYEDQTQHVFDPGTDPEVDVRHADEVGDEVTPDPASMGTDPEDVPFMDPAVSIDDMDNVRSLQTKLRASRENLLDYSLDDLESEEFRDFYRKRVTEMDSALERADVLEAELRRGAANDPSRANDIQDELDAIADEFGIPLWAENVGTDIVRYPPTPNRPARGIQRDPDAGIPQGPNVEVGGRTRRFGDADVDDDEVKRAHRAKRQEGRKRYTETGGVMPHGMSGRDSFNARLAGYADRKEFLSRDNYPLAYYNRKPDSMSDYDYFENIESPYRTNSALDTERHELAQRAELDRQAQGELDAELDPMRETEFKGPRIEDKELSETEFDMGGMDVDYENVYGHYLERLLDGEFGDFPDMTHEQAQKFARDAADRYFRNPDVFTGGYHPLGTGTMDELENAISADKTLTMSDIDALIEERLDAAGIPSNHPNRTDMVDRIVEDLDTFDRFDNDPDIQYQKSMPDLQGVARRALEGDPKKK